MVGKHTFTIAIARRLCERTWAGDITFADIKPIRFNMPF